ncbi:Fe(3+) dicitrate transport protein [Cnuella takakiae]|uniref:Fe(3+) dicitrate transport protein n=2 Tax=Cnuella takakiae TaxID=1302690 RepID=A0A1M5HU64_9BACT|nr:Fe(3+) dicitrate transport protein [Cnuella takakiae]
MGFATLCYAQEQDDSTFAKKIDEVIIRSWMRRDIQRMSEEQNGVLVGGKKNEVINLGAANANIAIKTGRQLFAKVPGVFVYDMDGSGNQLNIATRGLDPHRSWEYNVRQNGVIINSDMYGYPASHYSAPMESFEKIELVRGTGSLQYGAQFGGMINYATKKPDSTRPFSFESVSTVGSFGLVSTYNAVSGTSKRFSYYGYYYKRHSTGYRRNSQSDADAQFVQLQYRISDKASLKAEFGHSRYLYQIPGSLNDSMFKVDPTTSTRSRNYFSPDIYVPSLSLDWKLAKRTKLVAIASGLFGSRSSVMLDAFADVPDTINRTTGVYRNRQVDIDNFNSRTLELRFLHEYRFGSVSSKLATGVLYMNNDLQRRQLGKGTTGLDYDLTLVDPGFVRDLRFRTGNIALFAENAFHFGPKLVVSPGLRFEKGTSKMRGSIRYYNPGELPTDIKHSFLLAGVSTQYSIDKENAFYGGISQAYRPVLFKDIIPSTTYEQVDKNLKDASGYNAEAGVRGRLGHLQYDVSLFSVLYKNRMGTLVFQDNTGQTYTFRTNIGDSRTNGVEAFVQYKFRVAGHLYAGLFTSTSYMNAMYVSGVLSTGSENKSVVGNKVEAVPDWISRNGLDLLYKGLSITVLYNYTAHSYSDALNTKAPAPNGAKGLVPSYSIWDVNVSLKTNTFLSVRAGVNNLLDKQYFTKRPTMYPGAGIWPSDGRNAYVTIGLDLK